MPRRQGSQIAARWSIQGLSSRQVDAMYADCEVGCLAVRNVFVLEQFLEVFGSLVIIMASQATPLTCPPRNQALLRVYENPLVFLNKAGS